MVEVELVEGGNEQEYAEFVGRCPGALVQHTLGWREAVAGAGSDEPVYLLARERGAAVGALPAFLYRCELGDLMLSLPQAGGYGGVVVDQDSGRKEEVYAALLARLVAEAEARGCLCVTVCTPPFFGDLALYRKYLRHRFERENFFQYLDLEEDAVADAGGRPSPRLRENLRRNIRKAQGLSLTVTDEDSDARFDAWYDAYRRRMRQIGAEAIPRPLFEGIRRHVLARGHGFFLYVLDGSRVIGGGLFVGLNRVIDYFMASSDPEEMKKQPGSLLMYEAIRRAQGLGYRYWNWQSSESRRSPVYSYKAGWGPREGLHYYLTAVTGDLSKLLKVPLAVVREKYRWHYVLPFEEFEERRSTGGVTNE